MKNQKWNEWESHIEIMENCLMISTKINIIIIIIIIINIIIIILFILFFYMRNVICNKLGMSAITLHFLFVLCKTCNDQNRNFVFKNMCITHQLQSSVDDHDIKIK